MSNIPELLREILSELRELRRQMEEQTEYLDTLKAVAWEEAENTTRQHINERESHAGRKASAHLRRVLPSQKPLVNWLGARGFTFLNFKAFPLSRGPADELAVDLSGGYELLEPLVKRLLGSYGLKQGTQFSLAQFEAPQARAIVAFAQKLEDYGLLRAMNHVQAQNALFIQPEEDGTMNNFLSGGWLELRVEHLVAEMHSSWQPSRCLRNVQLKDAGRADYELDILLPSNGDPVHIECKSGDITAALPKVARTVAALGLPAERNLVVVPRISAKQTEAWQAQCEATFTSLTDLPQRLKAFLPSAH